LEASRVLLVGAGKAAELGETAAQSAGGAVVAALAKSGETDVSVLVESIEGSRMSPAEIAANLAFGARLRSYRFDKYRTKEKKDAKPTLKRMHLLVTGARSAKAIFARLDAVAEGVVLTRDLVSEPANILYPETLADRCQELTAEGVAVEILDETRLRKLSMGALLGVAQGSIRPPRVVAMSWRGRPESEDDRPLAFIGKGVTFDTGGISLKPGPGMEDMKWDMAGSGVVIGLMRALAKRKAKVNAVGVVGLVENMPSGAAQRPGDIVTSLSGQTIEVLNTDAEGRLVLADVLWYTQQTYKPRLMIDLATLTGAIIIALGHEHAGLFANDDEVAARLEAAGRLVGEKLWRLPLHEAYDKTIDSDAADVKNIAGDRGAGSIVGAQFLQRFVNGVPWAHLDIAGVAWSKKDAPTTPKGATGFGVRLLDRFLAEHYEG
jgi:leucyl aminopeptidase